ncbi:MAG TPA: hypothetical protein VEK57_28780 [Thermoanaerobaculia bacterium]|nr:hypothetical protein [Thermoanaerobaculia bacterium]
MRRLFPLLALLLSVSSAHAQAFGVRPDPPAPQAGQPFDIIVSGFWPTASLPAVRDVFMPSHGKIVITMAAEAEGDTVVTPLIARIAMPALAADDYHVDVRLQENGVVRRLTSGSFTVAGTEPAFAIGPAWGGLSGGLVTTVFYPTCTQTTCANAQVFFGDREATEVKVFGTTLLAITPPGARVGPVDVKVRIGSQEVVRPSVFTYVSPAQYETVLLPSHTDERVSGGFGSVWQVDSSVFNGNLIEMEPEVDYAHFVCDSVVLCIGPSQILPGRVNGIPTTTGFPREPNWLMHVRRPAADALRFSLRVRDTFRQGLSWGTELPVVHERDFATRVQLFDVPLQPRFRQTLRVYALPAGLTCCTPVTIRFHSLAGELLHSTTAQLRRSDIAVGTVDRPYPGSPDFPMQPENATLDFLGNIPELAGRESVRVEVDGGSRSIWAYVSVTNNESQQVTVVSPQ